MTAVAAIANLLLGAVYTSYGVMTIIDLKRGWRTQGFSHFGLAWIGMAFTCGPHHLEHGLHIVFAGRSAGAVDLVTVLVGLPAGITWFWLRVEALRGGRGDRLIVGTPRWVALLPALSVGYVVAFSWAGAAMILARGAVGDVVPRVTPNVLLLGFYGLIGYYMLRTQLANRTPLGGWSLSGLSIAAVFPTCGIMHAAYALYATVGRYDVEVHGLTIDWLSVPAALYFVWVTRSLSCGGATDWNRGATGVRPSLVAP